MPPKQGCRGKDRDGGQCKKPVFVRGLCRGHYGRLRSAIEHGEQIDPDNPPQDVLAPLEARHVTPLVTVGLRLPPKVAAEVYRAGPDAIRAMLGIWAVDQIRSREGAEAARAAGEEIAE
jgi:hypothetical protein